MVKLKIARVAAATAASAGLIAGFGGIVGASPSNYFGNHDHNNGSKSITNIKTISKNNVAVSNNVAQTAVSGDANAKGSDNNKSNNDWGYSKHHDNNKDQGNSGDATSGDTSNEASFELDGTISNSAAPVAGSYDQQGGSNHGGNLTINDVKTVSVNNVAVSNTVAQTAVSGEANASGGNNSGNATSGSASNMSDASVTLDVSN